MIIHSVLSDGYIGRNQTLKANQDRENTPEPFATIQNISVLLSLRLRAALPKQSILLHELVRLSTPSFAFKLDAALDELARTNIALEMLNVHLRISLSELSYESLFILKRMKNHHDVDLASKPADSLNVISHLFADFTPHSFQGRIREGMQSNIEPPRVLILLISARLPIQIQ